MATKKNAAPKKPAPITWKPITVKVKDLGRNIDNPKTKDEKGYTQLKKMVKKFGMVYGGIVNKDLSLIDGHSRTEMLNDDQSVVVFQPSRQLTPAEYKEMNAMYDIAKAGKTDLLLLETMFTEEQLVEWEIEMPKSNKVSFTPKVKPEQTEWHVTVITRSVKEQKDVADRLKKEGFKVQTEI